MNSKIQDTFRSQSRDTVKMPDWVTTLQQRILEADDVNAVVFDWRGGAYHGYRYTAVKLSFLKTFHLANHDLILGQRAKISPYSLKL